MKINSRGKYDDAILPGHPMADKRGRVALHRLVAAEKLGRPLTDDEVAHHRNRVKKDNRPENIEVKTKAKHASEHAKPKTMVALICGWCRKPFRRELRNHHRTSAVFCGRGCRSLAAVQHLEDVRAGMVKTVEQCEHGTYSRYRRGCRCSECRAANAARIRKCRNGV